MRQLILVAVGLLMFAESFGLAQTPTGMDLGSLDPARARAGLAAAWTGQAVLCAPAAILIGSGIAPLVADFSRRIHVWLSTTVRRADVMIAVLAALAALLVAVVPIRARSSFEIGRLVAAMAVVLVVGINARRRLGPSAGVLAAALVVVSPLLLVLPLANGQLWSRACVALALAAWLEARDRPDVVRWSAVGLTSGVAVALSPLACAPLLAPIAIDAAVSSSSRRHAIAGLALGMVIPLVVVGHWLAPTHPSLSVPTTLGLAWARSGSCAYESLALSVWFSGPLAAALVVLGAMTDRVTRLISFGIVAHLVAGVLVMPGAVHATPPVGSAECLAPLAMLATYGAVRALRIAARLGGDGAAVGVVIGVSLTLPALSYAALVALHS